MEIIFVAKWFYILKYAEYLPRTATGRIILHYVTLLGTVDQGNTMALRYLSLRDGMYIHVCTWNNGSENTLVRHAKQRERYQNHSAALIHLLSAHKNKSSAN